MPDGTTITAVISLADGTAKNLADWVATSPLSVQVPYLTGTHQVDAPILLLSSSGASRDFTATLLSVTSTYTKAGMSLGTSSINTITVVDDSEAPAPEIDTVVVEFESKLSGITRSQFLLDMATSYRQGVAEVSNVRDDQVAITSVTSTRRRQSNSISVATAVSAAADDGESLASSLQEAQTSGNLASSIKSSIEASTGTSIAVVASAATMKVILAPTPAPATPIAPQPEADAPAKTITVSDSFTVSSEAQEHVIKVSNSAGATVRFPPGALAEGVTVSAAKTSAPLKSSSSLVEGLPSPGSSMASVILLLKIEGSIGMSISIVLQHAGPARRQEAASAGALTRMHWFNKKTSTWTESCGDHSASPPGNSVRAVIEPSVLNHPGLNPVTGCSLCNGNGGLFALIDIQAANSACQTQKIAPSASSGGQSSTDASVSEGPNAGIIGGAVAGAGIVVIALGALVVYRRKRNHSGRAGQKHEGLAYLQSTEIADLDLSEEIRQDGDHTPRGTFRLNIQDLERSPAGVSAAIVTDSTVANRANQDTMEAKIMHIESKSDVKEVPGAKSQVILSKELVVGLQTDETQASHGAPPECVVSGDILFAARYTDRN